MKKDFTGKAVLRGFSFEAESSQVTFLAGKNGAGKTTWIRIAAGLAKATEGKVLFDGLSIEKVRDEFAIVLDEPPVYGHLNGFDNLWLLAGRPCLAKKELHEMMEALNLDEFLMKKKTRGYSLGQRHRLAVAAALLRRPTFLFLDELSIGLDPLSWQLVRGMLRKLADAGTAILVTGQDFNLMEQFVDKIVVLHDGVAVYEGPVKDLIGKFPVVVNVRTKDLAGVTGLFAPDRIALFPEEGRAEIKCSSREEAEQVAFRLSQSGMLFSELQIKEVSLQEAFLKLIGA